MERGRRTLLPTDDSASATQGGRSRPRWGSGPAQRDARAQRRLCGPWAEWADGRPGCPSEGPREARGPVGEHVTMTDTTSTEGETRHR